MESTGPLATRKGATQKDSSTLLHDSMVPVGRSGWCDGSRELGQVRTRKLQQSCERQKKLQVSIQLLPQAPI